MKYRIILAIIIIIAFLIAGLIIYANNVLLPVKLKAKITQELEKNLQKNVQIERLHYNIIKGLIVENFAIFDKTKEKTYLSVKEISFQFLFFPLFQRKLIIPLVRINSPHIFLTLRDDNTLNIMDVLKKFGGEKEKPKFSLFILKMEVSNGRCQFRDEHTDPAYTKEAVDLKIGAGINLPHEIKFILQGKILNPQNNPSFISVTGEYDLRKQIFQGKAKLSNLIVNDYLYYLKQLPLAISEGSVDNADLEVKLKEEQLSVKGRMLAKNIKLRKDKFVLTGDFAIEPDIKYEIKNKKLGYKAILTLSNSDFSGLDYFQNISNIKGKIYLEENKLWSDDLKAQVLDSSISIKAALDDFSNPYLKLNLSCGQVNLGKVASVLPNLPKDLTINGNSTLELVMEGSLKKLPLEIKAASEVTSAKIETPLLKEPLNDIKGKLTFSANQLNWENLSFTYKQAPYNSSGNIVDFQHPQIDFNLASKELSLTTSLDIKDNLIKIKDCSGKYLSSNFDLKGTIDTQNSASPLLNINLESDFAIKDAFGLLSVNISEGLKKLKLDGKGKAAGFLKGNAKDIKNWNASFKLFFPSLSVYEFKLDNLSCSAQQKDGFLTIEDLTAKPYGGNLDAQFSLNPSSQVPAYNSKIILSNIDLQKLKMDTKLKEKDISGILDMKLNLQGTTAGPETLQGQGTISVKDGRLWELNLFKGLGEFLFMPIYDKVVFSNADANFLIKDKAIMIANSFLGSEKLELNCEGTLKFDGTLDLTLNSQINEDLIKDSPDIRKFTSAVLGNLLVIKIGGTIQKPEYKIIPGTKEIFKQIKRLLLGK